MPSRIRPHAVRGDLLKLAKAMKDSPLAGADVEDVALIDGKIVSKQDANRAVSIATRCSPATPSASRAKKPTRLPKTRSHARNAHSAVFAEVKVDEELGVIRVTRVVNAVAAGRILNLKTAHSQIMGGVVWGIGMALHEETLFDHRFGRVMNANIAEYHVPVNADVHDIKVIFVEEPDDDRQSARHQGHRRNRHRRRGGGDRQRGLSRDRQARARPADHARQGGSVQLKALVRPRTPARQARACRLSAPARHAARGRWNHRSRPQRR